MEQKTLRTLASMTFCGDGNICYLYCPVRLLLVTCGFEFLIHGSCNRNWGFNLILVHLNLNLNSYMQVVAIRVDSATLNWKLDASTEMTSCFMLLGDEVQGGLRQKRRLEREAEAMLQRNPF